MRRLRLLGLALVAVFALVAVAASTAAAEEFTKLLPGAGVSFLLDQEAEGKLELKGGSTVTCKTGNGTGESTSYNLGTILILFTECKGPLSTVCTSVGAGEGLIAFTGVFHYWLAEHSGKLIAVLVGLFEPVEFTCKSKLISDKVTVEKGCAAGEVDPEDLEKLIESFYILYHQSKGVQEITEVLPQEAKEQIQCITKTKVGSGASEQTGVEVHFKVDTFENEAGEAITILLMNKEMPEEN